VTADASSERRQTTPWRIAPLSQRLVAGVVDAAVLTLVGFSASRLRRRSVDRRLGSSVMPVALDAAYRIVMTALAGHTLGQLTVGIRVVHQDSGTLPTWRQATLRWAGPGPL
jgi:uncharacterized RDD family membrane protein YckC